jgi:tetratricopeptide (TPR) repeat protein
MFQLQALAAAQLGQFDDALRLSQVALDEAMAAAGLDDDFALYWPVAIEYAIQVGDLDRAERLLALVGDAAPGLVTPLAHAHFLRLRGMVAAQQGRLAEADEDLSRAADELRAFGERFFLARAQLARAELMHTTAVPAADLLAEARQIFVSLGAQPWVESVDKVAAGTAV